VLESSAELPAGIIKNGNYHAEGLFDECLSIRSVPERFNGKYCTLFFKGEFTDPSEMIYSNEYAKQSKSSSNLVANTLNQLLGWSIDDDVRVKPKISGANIWTLYFNYPSLSLCLPSSCSASDLGVSVANIIGSYVISNQSIVTISDESFCFSDDGDSQSFDGPEIVVT